MLKKFLAMSVLTLSVFACSGANEEDLPPHENGFYDGEIATVEEKLVTCPSQYYHQHLYCPNAIPTRTTITGPVRYGYAPQTCHTNGVSTPLPVWPSSCQCIPNGSIVGSTAYAVSVYCYDTAEIPQY